MVLSNAYLTALTAGVVTAGLTGAVAALPEQAASTQRDVALTKTTIPITDVDQTRGPVHIVQKQEISFDADTPGQLVVANLANNSTTWTSEQLNASLKTVSGQTLTLFGDAAKGYGVGVDGAQAQGSGSFSLPGIGKGEAYGSVGVYSAKLLAIPSEGLVGSLSFVPISGGGSGEIALGDNALVGKGVASIGGNAQLCVGSTDSCEGAIASATATAVGSGGVTLTGPGLKRAFTFNSPTQVTAVLESDELSVTGQVGGTVTVGTRTVGRVRDVDIHIPTTSAVTLAGANRQAQSSAGAQQAAPGEKVKTAVRAAKHRAQSRHAAAD